MADIVVITGSGSGLGQAIAIEMVLRGYTVFAIDKDEKGLQQTTKLAQPYKIYPILADINSSFAHDTVLKFFNKGSEIAYLIHCQTTQIQEHWSAQAKQPNVEAIQLLTQRLKPYFIREKAEVLKFGNPVSEKTRVLGVSEKPVIQSEDTAMIVGSLNPGSMQSPFFPQYQDYLKSKGGKYAIPSNDPLNVAKFVANVLSKSTVEEFSKIKWDYRNQAHHELVVSNPMPRVVGRQNKARL